MRKKPTIAFMYDFDKTLCDQDMQNYSFIPNLNMTTDKFWEETEKFSKKNYMEGILAYMYYMMYKCKEKNIPFTQEYLRSMGKNVNFYKGVQNWFKRINQYGEEKGVIVEHYIISSGLKEMIEGTSIAHEFKKIYASSFYFSPKGVAVWPAQVVNYTNKIDFILKNFKQLHNYNYDKVEMLYCF